MKDSELQIDHSCHVLYSKTCKKEIQSKIALHYPEAEREMIWEKVQRQYVDFLLDWQAEHDDFYFVPRKINNKNRLEQGMYFRGNDDYMVLTFWDNADSKEFIYNIN